MGGKYSGGHIATETVNIRLFHPVYHTLYHITAHLPVHNGTEFY